DVARRQRQEVARALARTEAGGRLDRVDVERNSRRGSRSDLVAVGHEARRHRVHAHRRRSRAPRFAAAEEKALMPLYELEEGTSRKFYRIELHGNRVHLNWGRIGSEGEHQVL